MMLHTAPLFSIYFGNAQDNLFSNDYLNNTAPSLRGIAPFEQLCQRMHCDELVFLRQTHSTIGSVITEPIPSFLKEGDFLITQQRKLGLGVMTGDCLPLIIVESSASLIMIIHAGWRGAVAGIIPRAIHTMQLAGADPKKMQAFFGPCAQVCCYEVTAEFREHLERYADGETFLISSQSKLFFDLPQFCIAQLARQGISREALHLGYNLCTMHEPNFCSHRRDISGARPRQMTVVMLS